MILFALLIVRIVGKAVARRAVLADEAAEGRADSELPAHPPVEARGVAGPGKVVVRPLVLGAAVLQRDIVGPSAALPLGVDCPLHRAKRTTFDRDALRGRAFAFECPHSHDAAHGFAAIERALRTPRNLDAVGSRYARAAEKHGIVGVRVVQAQAVHQKQRLVGVRAAQEERRRRPGGAAGKKRQARQTPQGPAQRADLLSGQFLAGNEVDAAAQRAQGHGRARGGDHDFVELHGLRRRLGRQTDGHGGQRRKDGCQRDEAPARTGRRRTGVHICSCRLGGKSRNVGAGRGPQTPVTSTLTLH